MAEAVKTQKLAAVRKRANELLKDFHQKKNVVNRKQDDVGKYSAQSAVNTSAQSAVNTSNDSVADETAFCNNNEDQKIPTNEPHIRDDQASTNSASEEFFSKVSFSDNVLNSYFAASTGETEFSLFNIEPTSEDTSTADNGTQLPMFEHETNIKNDPNNIIVPENISEVQNFSPIANSQSEVNLLEEKYIENNESYDKPINMVNQSEQLEEQLHYYKQTVDILVAEKAELSSNLHNCQAAIEENVKQYKEVQNNLKNSEQHSVTLEKELNSLKKEHENVIADGERLAKLKNEYELLIEQRDELTQDLLELREKLNISANENNKSQKLIQELYHQQSMLNLKIDQITKNESIQGQSQIDLLTKEKTILEKKLFELNETVKLISKEREQENNLYQQYVQELNIQITTLSNDYKQKCEENELILQREDNMVRHINELEKLLQNSQKEKLVINNDDSRPPQNDERIAALTAEQKLLQDGHNDLLEEKKFLLQELEDKKEKINELQNQIEQLQDNQSDNGKLQASIESDKVAASRAIAQNVQLKQQLEEMQQAFIKMSNDKLELTEHLSTEEYRASELQEKVRENESQLHTLVDAITIKDKEFTELRNSYAELNKQLLQQDQLTDRLRHYEALETGTDTYNIELEEARKKIELLAKEKEALYKNSIAQITTLNHQIEQLQNKVDRSDTDEVISQTEVEVHNKENGLDSINKHDVVSQTDLLWESMIHKCDNMNILNKEDAMMHLENKFKQTMQNIANLTEEKQCLEHLVLQLQNETETIGEYITLYQHQRGVLKQRTLEKDEELRQLAHDRDQMKIKLDELTVLIRKLVEQQGNVAELLKHVDAQNMCDEHGKIHQYGDNKMESQNENSPGSHTAEKIINLLSEIKSSNLIQPSDVSNFHPCPLCSGQLITI